MTRTWLILEALALTLPATLLLAAGLPIAALSIVAIVTTLATDTRSLMECLFALLPYFCGLFAWAMLWHYVLRVAAGERLQMDLSFWAGVGAGFVATVDFLVTTPEPARLLVCVPLWLLSAHVLMLGVRQQTQRGPQLV